jgi:hypothetical protein
MYLFIYFYLLQALHKPCKYDCSLLDTQSIADITPSCFTFSKDFDNLFFIKYTEQYNININTNAIQRNPIKIYKIYLLGHGANHNIWLQGRCAVHEGAEYLSSGYFYTFI